MTADSVRELFGVFETIHIRKNITVNVEDFARLFADASENPTYDELVNIDIENGYGYKPFFDKCKEEGLLN